MKRPTYCQLFLLLLSVLSCGSAWAAPWWNCDWHYRTELGLTSTVATTNTVVHVELENANFNPDYSFTPDGADVRVLDSDNASLLDYHIENWDPTARTALMSIRAPSLAAGTPRTVYVYYGNTMASGTSAVAPASDPQSVYSESGWRYHTRNSTLDPTNAEEAFAEFDAVADGGAAGCGIFPEIFGRNNRNTFNGSSSNYALYAETLFEVTTPGVWSFRVGIDFGLGGDFFIDHVGATNRWNEDLWWNNNWNNGDVLLGSYNLGVGYHHFEALGYEICCDGTISVEYQSPGSNSWLQLNSANLNLVSAGCPVGVQDFSFVQTSKPNRFGGTTFLDNGNNGTAHNAVKEGNESGLPSVDVSVQVVGNSAIQNVTSDADGNWHTCVLDEAQGNDVKVSATIPASHYAVSESVGTVNSDSTVNAKIQFPVVGDNHYLDINSGFIEFPELVTNNTIAVGAGLTGYLPHRYTATSTAEVNFQVSQVQHQQSGVFSYDFFQDLDCDGALDSPAVPFSNPVSTQAGQEICMVIKVDASANVVESSILELRVDVATAFDGIPLAHNNSNSDIVNGAPEVALVLGKTVCNATQSTCDLTNGTGFGDDIVGSPNDELVYRLEFSAVVGSVNDVTVYDPIPANTKLKPSSIVIINEPAGLNCNITNPADQNLAGFTGTVKWECNGSMLAPQIGVVAFSVLVD